MHKPPRTHMTSVTFRLAEDLAAAIARLQLRDGISPSEQMRRALRAFLEAKGVMPALPTRIKKGGR